MKLFENQKGFSDTIVVAILGGIIGALFIAGVFVWQEYNYSTRAIHFIPVYQEAPQNDPNREVCAIPEGCPNQKLSAKVMFDYDGDTGWNVYHNNGFGFSMDYPKEYTAEIEDDSLLLVRTFSADLDNGDMGGRHTIRATFTKNEDSRTYFDFYSWAKNGFVEDNPSYLNKEEVMINGNEFVVFEVASGVDTVKHYFFFRGDMLIDIYSSFLGASEDSLNVGVIETIDIKPLLSNIEINERLKTGELECNTSITCANLGFICDKEVERPTCLEKGSLWPAGIQHEYSSCGCFDPNKEY